MEKDYFKFYKTTRIVTGDLDITTPILSGINRMERDIYMVLKEEGESTIIRLLKAPLGEEEYHISFQKADGQSTAETNQEMVISAGGDLGFIYAFLYISEKHLGITPFWFWNDQKIIKKDFVKISTKDITSTAYRVKYRGWFINDEVLINTWKVNGDNELVWEMAFEALLRLGGNLVIPGTDKNSRIHRRQAADMGLWISHHHAEPLGAEMFARAYPDLKPAFDTYEEEFLELWRQGIKEQKDMKVIWNLGFRGQGDRPFWADDEKYQTMETRGELISQIIKTQVGLVKEQVKNPVFCTNLYGEIMELYKEGYIKLPREIIRIRADNGYGKMVSRRQDLYNPRIPALTSKEEQKEGGAEGIYYHVSFYDLQAANHITMLPNSIEFVRKELMEAFSYGVHDFLIVNCSNVKPHVYFLEAVAGLWKSGDLKLPDYKFDYVKKYYENGINLTENIRKQMVDCFDKYALSTISYGEEEDEHAGEQFYNYMTRGFYCNWMQGKTKEPVENLVWATGEVPFREQINWYLKKCESSLYQFEVLEKECERIKGFLETPLLWQDSIILQVKLHILCQRGAINFCKAYQNFEEKEYQKAFYLMGRASGEYEKAGGMLRSLEHDKWKGFYANECLTDIKQTGYLLKHLMGYIRNIGEGPHFFEWQREYLYTETDRKVMLITNFENHATDEELFQYMEGKIKL